MTNLEEILREIEDRQRNNPSDLSSGGSFSVQAPINAIQSGAVRDAVAEQAKDYGGLSWHNVGLIPTGLATGAINTVLSGTPNILGLAGAAIGSGVEAISPFSGYRDPDVMQALRDIGYSEREAERASPYEHSWITSYLAQPLLEAGHSVDEYLSNLEKQALGNDIENPWYSTSRSAGTGLGFVALGEAAALTSGIPLLGALVSGGLESAFEAGQFLSDAHAQGKYDDALGITAANFLANSLVNIGLDATIGRFGKLANRVSHPLGLEDELLSEERRMGTF